MSKTLVVVESPAKAKTIEKYLGGDYAVRASYGHIRDLPKSDLGVDVDKGFEVSYEVPEDSKKHVAALKKALKANEDLILATDYDREGEAIAFHVATLLGEDPASAKRVTFTEITRDAILEAFARAEAVSGRRMIYDYLDKNREGDHVCYISDLTKMRQHYPGWGITKSLDDIFGELVASWVQRA